MRFALAALVALGCGCSGPASEGAVATVEISAVDRLVTESGDVFQPQSFAADGGMSALVETELGYEAHPLQPMGGDTYGVDFHPETGWWLRVGTQMFEVSGRFVDLGTSWLGRRELVYPEQASGLKLQFSNLEPWDDQDHLEFFFPNSGNGAFYVEMGTDEVVPQGSSQLSMTLYDAPFGLPLMDAAHGDVGWLFQLAARPAAPGGAPYDALSRVAKVEGLTQQDGVILPVTGAFATVPPTERMTLDWNVGAFFDALDLSSPDSQAGGATLFLVKQPGGLQDGFHGATADLVGMEIRPDEGVDRVTQPIEFGDPLPAAWALAGSVGAWGRRALTATGAERPTFPSFRVSTCLPRAALEAGEIAPLVGPPRSLQVGGKDAEWDVDEVGVTPVISWTAPDFGTPARYGFMLWKLGVNADTGRTTVKRILTVTTQRTRFRVPPEILEVGGEYAALYWAEAAPGADLSAFPNRTPFPSGFASAVSGIIRP